MGAGLRSILTLLKARKVLFVNPIARIQTGSHERRDPLPAHAEQIRASLLSPNPACAALTALATFHGLRAGELRNMQLTDLADGRLRLGQRSILLAEPVRVRLSAWLDYRNKRWPTTANQHVFLNHRNSTRTTPIGSRWLTLATGIPVHVMREDRILHEARATGGDIRRICDLFGLTVEGALRYLPNPDLDELDG
jgi:integrase